MTLEERQLAKEIADKLAIEFGTSTLSVNQFAKYLGKKRAYVCDSIRAHILPGAKVRHTFIIPVNSIALWEVRLSKTREAEN